MEQPTHILSRAVIGDQNKILLAYTADRDPKFYFLPGGHVESNEPAEKALLRELKEEVATYLKLKDFWDALNIS